MIYQYNTHMETTVKQYTILESEINSIVRFLEDKPYNISSPIMEDMRVIVARWPITDPEQEPEVELETWPEEVEL